MPNLNDAADSGGGGARFTRRIEDFTCGNCERLVRGNGYTNHCPHCLWSRHVDINPGDRAATCGGLMPPVAAGIQKDTYFVVQRCQKCGHTRRNKTVPQDSRETILTYFGRPIPG